MTESRIIRPSDACVIFGSNPNNDGPVDLNLWWYDEFKRAKAGLRHIQQGTKMIITVGGERFTDDHHRVVTEAESMKNRVVTHAHRRGIPLNDVVFLEENKGKETLEQTLCTVDILAAEGLAHSRINVVSSWHQLPRIKMILNKSGIPDVQTIIANPITLNRYAPNQIWNCSAGYSYTLLAIAMRKYGFWHDGGPVIRHYRDRRK
ncbi:YdcF family protein [Candidatus Gottesmanbacteria bacterium]|nr:YdcF family protein [Candidatus Gottesmanbacteria bacterium]